MKFKHWLNSIGSNIFAYFLIIIFLPICLLLFIGAILYTPIDFIKFKRSTYQKDFPRKYKWLCGRHTDNGIYTTIKENNLPVTFLKFYEDYELSGDFVYKDIVLNFSQPFFYDEKKEEWLFWPHNENENEVSDDEDTEAVDNTDDCLNEEESRAYILEQFGERYPDMNCTKIVFFYEYKFVKDVYGKTALEKMQQNNSFVIYRKRELKEALQKYILEN